MCEVDLVIKAGRRPFHYAHLSVSFCTMAAFGFRILGRAIFYSTLVMVLSDFFSIVYLIFSCAIKPGAFSDIKTLWLPTSKSSADSHIKVGYSEFYICVFAYFHTLIFHDWLYLFVWYFRFISKLWIVIIFLDSTSGSSFQKERMRCW